MSKSKIGTIQEALTHISSGQRILAGGFAGVGEPEELLRAIADSPYENLTLIGVDAGKDGFGGRAQLIRSGKISCLIATHMGLNAAIPQMVADGRIWTEMIPMGTLIEQIRCGGYGLGGVLTQTGLGTMVQENKRIIEIGGKPYLLEEPIRADVALVKAHKADENGNLTFYRTARNFNPLLAMAADYVIAEVDEILPCGGIDPDLVETPGVCVHMIVKGSEKYCREKNG